MHPQDTFSQITTGINGTGLHDILMQTVKAHLQQEYDAQRIRGADWAKVYLGALEAVLANTVSYLVQSALIPEQRLKIEADIDLVRAQEAQTKEQTRQIIYTTDVVLPSQVAINQAEKIRIETDTQKLEAEKLGIDASTARTQYETSQLLPKQVAKLTADIDLVKAETTKVSYEASQILPTQKLLLQEQVIKTTAETLLLQSQKLSTDQDYYVKEVTISQIQAEQIRISSDTLRIQSETKKGNFEADYLYPAQLNKLSAEVALLNAKVGSEALQPGLVQAQIQLLNQQIKGYTWDAAYKSYKITADSWSVARTSNPDLSGAPSSFLGASFAYY